MENNRLREIVKDYCNKNKNVNEDDLYIFLLDNQWKLYADYQKQSFKNVIKKELEENDYDANNVPEHIIEEMAWSLEEQVFDEGCFYDCISDVFDYYKEDLEEYKIIEVEDDDRSEMPHDYTNHFDSGEETNNE